MYRISTRISVLYVAICSLAYFLTNIMQKTRAFFSIAETQTHGVAALMRPGNRLQFPTGKGDIVFTKNGTQLDAPNSVPVCRNGRPIRTYPVMLADGDILQIDDNSVVFHVTPTGTRKICTLSVPPKMG